MKILLTGGGSGGHFYPLIAITEKLNALADKKKIAKMELVYMATGPYDKDLLLQNGIRFKKTYAGKVRAYFSLLNFFDIFKTGTGIIKSLWSIYTDFPDVIFSKGGADGFPAVFSARVLGIPVMIHESDTVPGKVNVYAGKFAKRIAISYLETAAYFRKNDKDTRIALTGVPVRKELFVREDQKGAREFFNMEENTPVIFITGGSLGAQNLNDNVLDILPQLVEKYQIIHQCGQNNFQSVKSRAELILEKSEFKSRYRLVGYCDFTQTRMALGAANLVISRAGSSLFEFAASGVPSILIPLNGSAQDHQKKNAYAYAAAGACDVLEEDNLTPHVLKSAIERLFERPEKMAEMAAAAKKFSRPDAAEKIAEEIINLALEHA